MRCRCLALSLLLTLAACGSSSAASEQSGTTGTTATHRTASCGPAGARTLAASSDARVYVSGESVYGCANGGPSYKLGASGQVVRENRVGPVAVAGKDAGYGVASFGVDTGYTEVVVRNLATGQELHSAVASRKFLVESFKVVDSIVVKSDGSVAWISEVTSVVSHRPYLEVHRLDSRGEAILDTGSGITTRSLRLRGSTLTWRDGSRTRTASLR